MGFGYVKKNLRYVHHGNKYSTLELVEQHSVPGWELFVQQKSWGKLSESNLRTLVIMIEAVLDGKVKALEDHESI